MNESIKNKFMEVYPILKSELLNDPAFDHTHASRQWIHQMVDYNVPRGKLNRGLSVVYCCMTVKEGETLSDDEIFLACVLGWCIEWLQACALVLDDIMDNSYTRRGQPCWFRVPKVGMIALNDVVILRNHVTRILKKHFREKPYYVDLLDLFNEVEFQSVCGEMLDLIVTDEGESDLSKYTLPLYFRIAAYKGAYYSIYLPAACALVMAGENLEDHSGIKDILIEIAAYYQVQDDFLDCFGDTKLTGKVGTDIEDRKCSWLVVKALEHADEEQKELLCENYGKADPDCVNKVKELYEVLGLKMIYAEYERKSFQKLIKSVEDHPSKVVKAVWAQYIGSCVPVSTPTN